MIKQIVSSIYPLSKKSLGEIDTLINLEDWKKGEVFIKRNKNLVGNKVQNVRSS